MESSSTGLLGLPSHVLLRVLQCLDAWSLCAASRACLLLFKLASLPELHPHYRGAGAAEWDVR